MLPSRAEATSALYGLYRMVWLDRRAAEYFDLSAMGARRSLWLIALAVPFAALGATLAADRLAELPQPGLAVFVRFSLEFIISWAGFLLLLRLTAIALDRPAHFAPATVLFNWVALIRYGLVGIASLMAAFGGPPYTASSLLTAVTLPLLLMAEGYAYRLGLDVPIVAAVGLVILRFIFDALVKTLL